MAERSRENETKHYGLNLHLFHVKKEILQDYRCGVCTRVLDDPQQIIVCGHQFCRLCLPAKECPTCYKDFKKDEVFPDESVRQKIGAFQVRCPGRQCNWKGTFKHFQEVHKQECPYRLVECNDEGCRQQVPQELLTHHQEHECEYRQVLCTHCHQIITVAFQKDHEKVCKRIKLDCPNQCTNKIPREELPQHRDNDCEKEEVDCSFKKVGCQVRIARGELANHLRESTQEHLYSIMSLLDKTSREKDQLTMEMNQLRNQNKTLKNELDHLTQRQDENVQNIIEDIKQIEEIGTTRLETIQKATEQNFDGLAGLVQQNEEINKGLLLLQGNIESVQTTSVEPFQTMCLANDDGISKIGAEQEKSRKIAYGICQHFTKTITELKNELETRQNELSEQHDQEYIKTVEFEQIAVDKMYEMEKAIETNRTELRTQNTASVVEKDANDETYRNVCTQMVRDYESLADMITNEKRSRCEAFEILSKDVTQPNSLTFGSLVWKVTNVNTIFNIAMVDPRESKTGPGFFSEQHGYYMRPKLFLNGARHKDRGHISIFVQLLPGPNDVSLQWPFHYRVSFTLLDQRSTRRDVQKQLLPKADAEELRRPDKEPNNGYGIYQFVEHQSLLSNYVVNDTMYIRIDVLANDDQGRSSETI